MLTREAMLGGLSAIFLATGGGLFVGLTLLLTVKYPRRPEYYAKQTEAAMVFDTAEPIPKAAS